MQIPRVDPSNVKGLADKVIGLAKEIVGTVTGQDRLTKAGQIQQEAASERLKALQAELRADTHDAKAASAGTAQKSAQKTKEAVNN